MDLISAYYRAQEYINIGWGEVSWFTNSLIELMAVLYILEYMDITVRGNFIFIALIAAFIFFYNFGKLLKRTGVYDKSSYVSADIDPVTNEILEASRLIIEHYKNKGE